MARLFGNHPSLKRRFGPGGARLQTKKEIALIVRTHSSENN